MKPTGQSNETAFAGAAVLPHEAEVRIARSQTGPLFPPRPAQERAVEYARETAASVGDTVQRNPLPVALAGLALAVLVVRRQVRARRERALRAWLVAAIDRAPHDGLARARSAVTGAAGALTGLAHDAADNLSHVVGDAAARAQRFAASPPARHAIDDAKRVVASIETSSRQQPLLALGVALVAGAALCSVLRR